MGVLSRPFRVLSRAESCGTPELYVADAGIDVANLVITQSTLLVGSVRNAMCRCAEARYSETTMGIGRAASLHD